MRRFWGKSHKFLLPLLNLGGVRFHTLVVGKLKKNAIRHKTTTLLFILASYSGVNRNFPLPGWAQPNGYTRSYESPQSSNQWPISNQNAGTQGESVCHWSVLTLRTFSSFAGASGLTAWRGPSVVHSQPRAIWISCLHNAQNLQNSKTAQFQGISWKHPDSNQMETIVTIGWRFRTVGFNKTFGPFPPPQLPEYLWGAQGYIIPCQIKTNSNALPPPHKDTARIFLGGGKQLLSLCLPLLPSAWESMLRDLNLRRLLLRPSATSTGTALWSHMRVIIVIPTPGPPWAHTLFLTPDPTTPTL